MKTYQSRLAMLLLGSALLTSSAFATTLLDMSSIVTSGSGQNAYAASTTALGSGAGTFSTTSTSFTFTSGVATASAGQDYFILKLAQPATLTQVGDKLTLNFSVTATNLRTISGTPRAFRFGLFDVGSATDGSTTTFKTATGYYAGYGRSDGNGGIYERASATTGNIFADSANTLLPDPNGTSPTSNYTVSFGSSLTFTGSLTFELLDGNQVKITSTAAGDPVSYVTDATGLTSFNAISFFEWKTSGVSSLTFTDLSLTFTSVPEPATNALVIGTLFILGLIVRRNRLTIGAARSID